MSAMNSHFKAVSATQPAASNPSRPHLRLVESFRQHTVMSRRKLATFISVLLGVVVLQLTLATVMMQDAYRAEDLKAQRVEIERERTAAIEAADAAASPQQLAERATNIGMVPSNGYAYLNIASGTIEGDSAQAGQTAAAIDPGLVENKAADPVEQEFQKAEPGKKSPAGASNEPPAEPAVPSEFELRSPETH